jgi:predicted nucleic acid-binding protein
VILDASFLIDIQNGVQAAVDTIDEIESAGRPLRVPHLVVYELYIGVGKGTQSAENRARIDAVLGSLTLEPTTLAIVRRAGELEGSLQQHDRAVGAVDAIVAATALSYDEPVVTADDHFSRIDGLDVVSY